MEVTRGHQQFFANNLRTKKDKDVRLLSLRLSSQGASNDVQFDLLGSPSDLALTWPEVKFWHWPFKVKLYVVRRALTRQTRWYQNRCSTFKIKDCIVQKTVLENFGILTPGDLNFDLSQKMTEMIYKLFFASFRTPFSVFFSTMRRSRDRRGGVQTPPPPSRWWKIQRPIRARVKWQPDLHSEYQWQENLRIQGGGSDRGQILFNSRNRLNHEDVL